MLHIGGVSKMFGECCYTRTLEMSLLHPGNIGGDGDDKGNTVKYKYRNTALFINSASRS
jgi:hypothetical protein